MITVNSRKEYFQGEVTDGQSTVITDSSVSMGGSGKHFTPGALLAGGLASCLNSTTRRLLKTKGIKFDKVVTSVDFDVDEKNNTTTFEYKIDIQGNISKEDKEEYATEAYNMCFLHRALSNKIQFSEMKK